MKLNSNVEITLVNSIKLYKFYILYSNSILAYTNLFDALSVKRACAKTTGLIQLKIVHSFYFRTQWI